MKAEILKKSDITDEVKDKVKIGYDNMKKGIYSTDEDVQQKALNLLSSPRRRV